ncbi:hypothetical protein [Pseudoxanthomonas japonensis]|uniref:hypothetical protein n=1 Tax=Pseudoxanthomonas japonensis TaxID=69284 RepID=UPI003748BC47
MKENRPSRFVTLAGSLLDLGATGYGVLLLLLQPSNPVADCGAKCATERAVLDLLGQPLFNLGYGLAWIAIGLFVVMATRLATRPKR